MTARASDHYVPPETSPQPFRAEGPRRWSEITLSSVLILFSVLPYSNTLLNGFISDDITQILDNPYILSFRHLGKIFTTTVWSYVGNGGYTNYYRPLMTFGYLLCFQVFGPEPYGYHLANILLHAGVVCILYLVTKRMFASRAFAFVAAGLFALHPMHSESVNWIAAVTDLEVTLFFLLTFWFFLGVPRPEGRRSEWAILATAASYVLTIFAKEQALMLPALATVYEHFYRQDRNETTFLQKVSRYAVLWLISVAYILFRMRMFGSFAPIIGHADVTRYEAFLSGFGLVGQYIKELFWPVRLCAYYPFHASTTLMDPRVYGGIAAMAGCAGVFAFLWRRERQVSFGMVWLFATLAPVLNVRMLASDSVFAERYIYLPSVGFCWLVAFAGIQMWNRVADRKKIWRWSLAGAAGIIAVLFALRIVTRNRDWRNEVVFYTTTLAAAPDAVFIHNNLGGIYWNRDEVDAAEREWRTALELAPDSPTLLNNLGLVYEKRNQYPKAIEYFKDSIRAKPVFPDPHLNLGILYHKMGSRTEAELQYRAAMDLAPLNVHIRNRLGSLYLEEGRIQEAEKQFTTSASIAPNVVAYDALGEILMERGAIGPAAELFQRSLGLNARDTRARMNLARIFEAGGRKLDALGQYQAILKYDPGNDDAKSALQRTLPSSVHKPNGQDH